MPNIMLSDITTHFHIDATVFGQFSGIYYIGYSLMHLPIGIMLDKFGPRKVMTSCILLTVIGLLPLIFSDYWLYPLIGRAMIGIGSSAAILGVFKIVRMTFREQHFARMLGFSVMIGLIGAIYGGAPVSFLCQKLGYQAVIKIFIAVGLILSIITYLIIPDGKIQQSFSILKSVNLILRNPKILCLCVFSGFMLGPLEGFSDVWGSEFLKEVYHLHAGTANYLPSLIYIGMCVGSPLLSYIAEKSGYYIGTVISSGFVMFLIFSLLLNRALSVTDISFSFIVLGICCAYQIIAIYKISTYVPEHIAGLATAVANMIIMLFGYAFHSVIGYVITINGGIHDQNAYLYGISVIPIGLLIGALGFVIISCFERFSQKTLFSV